MTDALEDLRRKVMKKNKGSALDLPPAGEGSVNMKSPFHESESNLSPSLNPSHPKDPINPQKEDLNIIEENEKEKHVQEEEKEKEVLASLFPNKSTIEEANLKEFLSVQNKEKAVSLEGKAVSLDEGEEKKNQKKAIKIVLQQVGEIKKAVRNMNSAVKGLEYIQKRIKYDKNFRQKIKKRVHLLQQIV